MLSFASEFPVRRNELGKFFEAVLGWLEGSPHSKIKGCNSAEIPLNGHWSVVDADESLDLLVASGAVTTAGFKHSIMQDGIQWVTHIVFSCQDEESWVGVRTSRESDRAQISLPPAKKPQVVRYILASLGGGLDGELYVDDKPFFLKPNDLGMAARLINGDSENYLPVLYVSQNKFGNYSINVNSIARSLGGVAHVIVEPSEDFSNSLYKDVGRRRVCDGRVGLYWPSGERFSYGINHEYPSDAQLRGLIVGRIRQALLNRRPFARCSWSRVEVEAARGAFEALRQGGSEDIAQYIQLADSEIAARERQLLDAEAEIVRLNSSIRSLSAKVSAGGAIDIDGEVEFFPGEFNEIIFDAIESSIYSGQSDGRRVHVLEALKSSIESSGNMKEKADRLKNLLRDYKSMDKNVRDGLIDLGFSIDEAGRHIKIQYMHDPRYVFSMPKTGSDHRGGLNLASDIKKRVF